MVSIGFEMRTVFSVFNISLALHPLIYYVVFSFVMII